MVIHKPDRARRERDVITGFFGIEKRQSPVQSTGRSGAIIREGVAVMKIKIIVLCAAALLVSVCDQPGKGPTAQQVLISKGFIDDNTYRIVCRGYPEQGLTGVAKTESSRQAARLNAYVFLRSEFVEAVDPGRFGTVEKYDYTNNYAIIYYVLRKKGLKKMIRIEPKPDPAPGPDNRTDSGRSSTQDTGKNGTPETDSSAALKPAPDGTSGGTDIK